MASLAPLLRVSHICDKGVIWAVFSSGGLPGKNLLPSHWVGGTFHDIMDVRLRALVFWYLSEEASFESESPLAVLYCEGFLNTATHFMEPVRVLSQSSLLRWRLNMT